MDTRTWPKTPSAPFHNRIDLFNPRTRIAFCSMINYVSVRATEKQADHSDAAAAVDHLSFGFLYSSKFIIYIYYWLSLHKVDHPTVALNTLLAPVLIFTVLYTSHDDIPGALWTGKPTIMYNN